MSYSKDMLPGGGSSITTKVSKSIFSSGSPDSSSIGSGFISKLYRPESIPSPTFVAKPSLVEGRATPFDSRISIVEEDNKAWADSLKANILDSDISSLDRELQDLDIKHEGLVGDDFRGYSGITLPYDGAHPQGYLGYLKDHRFAAYEGSKYFEQSFLEKVLSSSPEELAKLRSEGFTEPNYGIVYSPTLVEDIIRTYPKALGLTPSQAHSFVNEGWVPPGGRASIAPDIVYSLQYNYEPLKIALETKKKALEEARLKGLLNPYSTSLSDLFRSKTTLIKTPTYDIIKAGLSEAKERVKPYSDLLTGRPKILSEMEAAEALGFNNGPLTDSQIDKVYKKIEESRKAQADWDISYPTKLQEFKSSNPSIVAEYDTLQAREAALSNLFYSLGNSSDSFVKAVDAASVKFNPLGKTISETIKYFYNPNNPAIGLDTIASQGDSTLKFRDLLEKTLAYLGPTTLEAPVNSVFKNFYSDKSSSGLLGGAFSSYVESTKTFEDRLKSIKDLESSYIDSIEKEKASRASELESLKASKASWVDSLSKSVGSWNFIKGYKDKLDPQLASRMGLRRELAGFSNVSPSQVEKSLKGAFESENPYSKSLEELLEERSKWEESVKDNPYSKSLEDLSKSREQFNKDFSKLRDSVRDGSVFNDVDLPYTYGGSTGVSTSMSLRQAIKECFESGYFYFPEGSLTVAINYDSPGYHSPANKALMDNSVDINSLWNSQDFSSWYSNRDVIDSTEKRLGLYNDLWLKDKESTKSQFEALESSLKKRAEAFETQEAFFSNLPEDPSPGFSLEKDLSSDQLFVLKAYKGGQRDIKGLSESSGLRPFEVGRILKDLNSKGYLGKSSSVNRSRSTGGDLTRTSASFWKKVTSI